MEVPESVNLLFDRVLVNGTVVPVTLTVDGLLRWTEGAQERCLILEKEVLGFLTEGQKIKIRAIVQSGDGFLCFGGGKGGLVRKEFVFEPLLEDSLRLWCQKLSEYIDSLGRPKRLFVFVNPYGGKKSAEKIYSDHVKPLLEDADVQITLQETKHQLHAKETVQRLDLNQYDGIVCVSGDGILVEVINGLLQREDWVYAIKMPIGVVPAGTGNGMAKSLLDSVGEPCAASNATLAIIRGHKCLLDVATILQGEKKFFSVLMLAWGLIADIDIGSEKYRWMGSARLDVYALERIFHLRHYSGRISFVPAPGFEAFGEPTNYEAESTSEQEIFSASNEEPKIQQHGYQGPDIELRNLNWRAIDGPFVSIWLHNVPWGGEDTMAAPDAKFSDGFMDLVLIKDIPKLALLSLMLGLSDGTHVKSPFVKYLKVKAFILQPGPRVDEPEMEGIIDTDGEVLARGKGTYQCERDSPMTYDKLQITSHQGLATLFSPV